MPVKLLVLGHKLSTVMDRDNPIESCKKPFGTYTTMIINSKRIRSFQFVHFVKYVIGETKSCTSSVNVIAKEMIVMAVINIESDSIKTAIERRKSIMSTIMGMIMDRKVFLFVLFPRVLEFDEMKSLLASIAIQEKRIKVNTRKKIYCGLASMHPLMPS